MQRVDAEGSRSASRSPRSPDYRPLGAEEDEIAANVWLRPEYTDCMPLRQNGISGVLCVDRLEG